jgi:hypothetical protein
MNALYAVMYAGAAIAILASMIDAIKSVTRNPVFRQSTGFVERRTRSLQYVGLDRRQAQAGVATTTQPEEPKKAA